MSSRPPAVVPTVDEAVAASLACAAELGIAVDSHEVIASGYSVRVLLHPAQLVTRVLTQGQVLRGDPLPWLQREIAVAGFLARRGAPVVPPAATPGPYRANGLDVTLLEWREHAGEPATQEQLGPLLFDLHERLAEYDGDLPLLVGPLTDITTALEITTDETLHRAAARLLPEAAGWPRRPLHGDVHTGNLLSTPQGHLWLDFEDACVGPTEWDFASLTITDEAVAAYPGLLDPELLRRCRQLRRLQVLAAVLTDPPSVEGEELRPGLVAALGAEFD